MKKIRLFLFAACWLLTAAQSSAQRFFFSAERPTTCAAADGIVTIVPTAGTPPFAYLWGDGSTAVSLRNVAKGIYSATLTDANGSTFEAKHILNSDDLDLQIAAYLPASYCNQMSGMLTVEPIGGTAPFSYSWSNSQTGAAATGLALGNYAVVVTDATGCTAIGEYSVGQPNANYFPYAQVWPTAQPDCGNANGGALTGTITYSGYPPYSYQWSNGATAETISGLAEGSYQLTVTDALGCSTSAGLTLQKAITMTGSTVCTGTATGTATAQLVAEAAPIGYTWENGATGPSRSGLASGTYIVTAADANGCTAIGFATVAIPELLVFDNSPDCYAGNGGSAYSYVVWDNATTFLWDNGSTDSQTGNLGPPRSLTATTALGCTLTESVIVPAPAAPPYQFLTTITPADCSNSLGGSLNLTVTGGIQPFVFYAYGSNGTVINDPALLQNVAADDYTIYVYAANGSVCNATATATVPDAGGFNPKLEYEDLDCDNGGYGSAAILGVALPGAQFAWSTGNATPDVYSLTAGCYSVTVTGGGTCLRNFQFCIFGDKDSLQLPNTCGGLATGQLINDLGAAGCAGSLGIPYQLFKTLPSGALNLTDENGVFNILVPGGDPFDILPVQYDAADIACPPGGLYSVNIANGGTLPGLDFHFLNTSPIDHRAEQRPLRTAQPGYPFSVRFKVCNDGNSVNPGTLALDYGNLFGGIASKWFAQHPAAFSLDSETPGAPENHAQFSFPGIAAGGCELLQADFSTPTTSSAGSQFLTKATVSPASGDPTPSNNSACLYNLVAGSFDPNAVYAFPARNGNPHDGGDILKGTDKSITYQIHFQNTGSAPANSIIVRDTLDAALNLESLRNISASHDVKIDIEGNNSVLVFKFPNINLPDSSANFANSTGSIQYDIDLKPGLPTATKIGKSAAIYFDFNPPVITNRNVLTIVETLATDAPAAKTDALKIFPNPTAGEFRFFAEKDGELAVFSALGQLVLEKNIAAGPQSVDATGLPPGVYLVKLAVGGKFRTGKLVVQR